VRLAKADLGVSPSQVRIGDSNVLAFPGGMLGCAVIPHPEQHDDSRINLQLSIKPISLSFGAQGADAAQQLERALADARVALLADLKRGGVALVTSVVGSHIFDASPGVATRTAQMDLVVEYRTLYEDPTTSF
jgi:hypothetical protein